MKNHFKISITKIENLNITGTAIQLNEILHNHEISAHHRCTLIGGILLALEDEGFRVSYKSDSKSGDKPNPKKLTKRILDGIKNVLVEKKKRQPQAKKKNLGFSKGRLTFQVSTRLHYFSDVNKPQ